MTSQTTETKSFQAEVRQLLNILVHSLYTDREIFLRELISNASDALHRVKFEMLTNQEVLDPDAELVIRIQGDPEKGLLIISDTGVGMTRDELIENLGTIAHSGAAAFLKSLQEGKQSVEQIGRFGVGFYSVFMVAEEVRVTSRSFRPDAEAWSWIASGEDSYRLEPATKTSRGTTIEIKLKEDAKAFAEVSRLRSIIHKHSDFVSFPIYVGDSEEPINRQQAPWRLPASELSDEAATEFYKQLTFDLQAPLKRIQVQTDAPVQLYALLFIPSKLERGLFSVKQDYGLRLYSQKVRIQDHCKDLLPDYLRFIEGVVDCEDIPLNVSRESVQSNRVMQGIKKVLTSRVLNTLRDMASKDAENYEKFWKEFGPFIKEGLATEFADRERLTPLLRFVSSKSGDRLISLNDYILRVKAGQKSIYYLVGDNLEAVKRSPHLEYFRAEDIEVLYFADPLDGFIPSALGEYEGFKFQNVDDAGLELPERSGDEADEEAPGDDRWEALIARFKKQLGERVRDVRRSHVLVDSPARLVSPEGSVGSEMERVRRLVEKDFELPPKILELNPRHPIIENLTSLIAEEKDAALNSAVIEQIFANALLLEGFVPEPAEMVARIQTVLEVATQSHLSQATSGDPAQAPASETQ